MTDLLSSVTPSQSVSTNSIITQNQQHLYIPEKEGIWSKILTGVASSKIVPTKNILILGEPGAGKSTLVHYLKNDPGPQQISKFEDEATPFHSNTHHTYTHSTTLDKNDLALSYSFVDVKDDENEAMARLGIYQLGLASPEYLPLLKFAISSETISDACVLLLLDWTRPWKFVETLQRWINVLNYILDSITREGMSTETNWSKGRAILDELREKLEHHLQLYTEPSIQNGITVTESISTNSIPSTTTTSNNFVSTPQISSTVDQVMLPLSAGCLTYNPGLPLIIVCNKSDAMSKLEQTYDYQDDQFDFIQQTLRCIALKYGAALFYTSTVHSYTYHNLREYILHRLLTTPAKSYPFNLKAQVLERDTILVPSGWDSWSKIRILKESFECENISEGWDNDMAAVMDRQNPGNTGTRGIYEECIPKVDSEVEPLHVPIAIVCEDEQSFYDRHYDKLQKNNEMSNGRNGTGSDHRPGVVGPMGISAATIQTMIRGENNITEQHERSSRKKDPTLEKLLMKGINTGQKLNGHLSSPLSPNATMGAQNTTNAPTVTSPTSAVNQNSPSHEVLANFFQSLLKSSSGGPGSPTTINSSSPSAAMLSTGTGGHTNTRNNHKDLDVMRQYTISK